MLLHSQGAKMEKDRPYLAVYIAFLLEGSLYSEVLTSC